MLYVPNYLSRSNYIILFHDIDFGQNYLARNWACKIKLPSGTIRTKCGEPRITSQMMVPLPRISYDVSRWPHMLDAFLSAWTCITQSKQIICCRKQWILKVFSRVEGHYHLETLANHFIFRGCFSIRKIKKLDYMTFSSVWLEEHFFIIFYIRFQGCKN